MVVPRLLRVASFRFAALCVVLFAVSAVILGATVFREARSALQRQMTSRIENEVRLLTEDYRTHGLAHLVEAMRERAQRATEREYLLQSHSGAHLAGNLPVIAGLRPGWTAVAVSQPTDDPRDTLRIHVLVVDLGSGTLLAVGQSDDQIEELEEAIGYALVWTVGIAGTLGVVVGAMVSGAFLKRVDSITSTAEAIIGGDLTRRVPLAGTSDDFDRLAATLNRMLERIALLMESLRQVSSDVAHDLRTPLTRLYQRLEVAREFAKGEPTYEASINAALAEAQGLLDTFSALLRIAQVEGGSPRSRFRLVDLTAVAETVADAYRPDAEQGGRLLISRLALGAFVSGDQELLTQAVANLVENAVRHTPSGTRVDVRLQDHGEAGLVLSVEDDGPGVSKAELPRLTDRFYRAECSRTTPGNGLGLTLVSAIAELHGTTLELSATSPGFRAAMAFVRSKRLNGAVPHV
jgi:signal transduction histidine kinase